jgi:hypothetical protein
MPRALEVEVELFVEGPGKREELWRQDLRDLRALTI